MWPFSSALPPLSDGPSPQGFLHVCPKHQPDPVTILRCSWALCCCQDGFPQCRYPTTGFSWSGPCLPVGPTLPYSYFPYILPRLLQDWITCSWKMSHCSTPLCLNPTSAWKFNWKFNFEWKFKILCQEAFPAQPLPPCGFPSPLIFLATFQIYTVMKSPDKKWNLIQTKFFQLLTDDFWQPVNLASVSQLKNPEDFTEILCFAQWWTHRNHTNCGILTVFVCFLSLTMTSVILTFSCVFGDKASQSLGRQSGWEKTWSARYSMWPWGSTSGGSLLQQHLSGSDPDFVGSPSLVSCLIPLPRAEQSSEQPCRGCI